jgi:hypothetical protein
MRKPEYVGGAPAVMVSLNCLGGSSERFAAPFLGASSEFVALSLTQAGIWR